MTSSKHTSFPRAVEYSKTFKKDWERLSRSGRYDMNRLKAALVLIFAKEPLGAEYKDHALTGNWDGFRECHVGGDFLLIYQLFGNDSIVVFTRVGTHSELFK